MGNALCKWSGLSRFDFAKTFIQVEEELKIHVIHLKSKLEIENKNGIKFESYLRKFKNERTSDSDLTENSIINIKICSLVLNEFENILGELVNKMVLIQVNFGDMSKGTNAIPLSGKTLEINEKIDLYIFYLS